MFIFIERIANARLFVAIFPDKKEILEGIYESYSGVSKEIENMIRRKIASNRKRS